MPTQLHLPVQPAGAREINAVVAIVERDEQVAYFASGVPLFVHRADDPVGRRVAAGQMMALGLARQDELSAALRVNRTTLYRQHRKLQAHGVLGRGRRQARAARPASVHRREAPARGGAARGRAIDPARGGAGRGDRRHDSPCVAARRTPARADPARARLGPANPERAGGERRGRRGGPAAHRARPGPAGPVDGSGPAVRRRRGRALWRRLAGPAGGAHARPAGRGAAGLRRLEERVLRAAGHAALPDLHGPAARPHAGATAGAPPGRTGDPARARPRARGQDPAAQAGGVGGPAAGHAVQPATGRALGPRPRGRRRAPLRRWPCAARTMARPTRCRRPM